MTDIVYYLIPFILLFWIALSFLIVRKEIPADSILRYQSQRPLRRFRRVRLS